MYYIVCYFELRSLKESWSLLEVHLAKLARPRLRVACQMVHRANVSEISRHVLESNKQKIVHLRMTRLVKILTRFEN